MCAYHPQFVRMPSAHSSHEHEIFTKLCFLPLCLLRQGSHTCYPSITSTTTDCSNNVLYLERWGTQKSAQPPEKKIVPVFLPCSKTVLRRATKDRKQRPVHHSSSAAARGHGLDRSLVSTRSGCLSMCLGIGHSLSCGISLSNRGTASSCPSGECLSGSHFSVALRHYWT